MLQSGNNTDVLDQSESSCPLGSDYGPSVLRFDSAKRAIKIVNEKLRRSAHHKTHVILYRYNKYMTHPYVYMMKMAMIREPESFVEAS